MNRLAIYIRPYWKTALLAPLLMMLEVATDLLQPKLMANIVDQGIARGDMDFVFRTGLIMVGVAILGVLGGLGSVIFSSIAAQNYATDLRSDLFKQIQSFSFASLDKFSTASLITRLTNDVVQVQNIVLMMMRIMVRAPLLSVGGLIMALTINPGLAMILLVTVPILVAALALVIRRGLPLFSLVQKGLDRVNTVIRENLAGVRVVKAFVRSDYETKRFGSENDNYMEIAILASRVVGMIMPVMTLILNLSILAVIWFGGLRVNTGNMQVGEVMAFINYMTQILFSLLIVGYILVMFSRAKVSADRILEVLNTETDIKDQKGAADIAITTGRLDFNKVTFHYKCAGGEPVLRNISFTALPGENVAILGGTGSGKSTLVNLIPRFYDATEGQVLVDGIDVRNYRLANLRRGISMVLQEPMLFSGTIRDNILWGQAQASDEEIIQAAEAAQAHDFIMKLPEGYHTVIGQRGINLSGGQKQRIAIARALIRKPAILILDDSTSAVDMATEKRIQNALAKILTKTTRIVVAQRINTVLDADKILVLEDGELISQGTHRELIDSCPVYQDIYYSQVGAEVI